MSKNKQIKDFYDNFAQHFAQTRRKKRPEEEIIRSHLINYKANFPNPKKKIHILDIGCGSGRLFPLVLEIFGEKVLYSGSDISPELIKIAQKEYPQADFKTQDMITLLEQTPQESVDIVISLASIQHLQTKKERLIALRNIYKALHYDGIHITINRSFSDRFIKKFRKQIFAALGNRIRTKGKRKINDLFIPRNDTTRQGMRFYHIFTLGEIIQLHKQAGFVIHQGGYTTHTDTTTNRHNARNTLIIAKKQIEKIN